MKRLNPDAQKELTVLAVKLSGTEHYKAIGPSIVFMPNEQIVNVKGELEPLVMHICRAAKLLAALNYRKDKNGRQYDLINIWKQHCGIVFPFSPQIMFCSKCFDEFDGKFYKMLSVIKAAGTLKL